MPKEELELGLFECTAVILKRKWVILPFVTISVLAAGFIASTRGNVYESRAMIGVMPLIGNISGVSVQSYIPTASHKELLKSSDLLKQVINSLALANKDFEPVDLKPFSRKLDFFSRKRMNIIHLIVRDPDPKMAREILDTWMQEYMLYYHRILSKTLGKAVSTTSTSLENLLNSIAEKEGEFIKFTNKNRIDMISSELAFKKERLNIYKSRRYDLTISLELKNTLETPERENTVKNNKLRLEIAHYKKLEDKLKKEITVLRNDLFQKEIGLSQLKNELAAHNEIYKHLVYSKIASQDISAKIRAGTLAILSTSSDPISYTGSKVFHNAVISFLASLVFSIFIVLSVEYLALFKHKLSQKARKK